MPDPLSFNVENIPVWHDILSTAYAARLIVIGRRNSSPEKITLQLETSQIDSPCLNGGCSASLELTWGTTYDDECRRSEASVGQTRLVEDAAVGVAGVLFPNVVDARFVNVVQIGDKFDYLMGTPQGQFGLEISGSEKRSGLNALHQKKRKQLLANVKGKDGYVVVCGFREKRVIFSFHRFGEETA